jgi:hypothetical protein
VSVYCPFVSIIGRCIDFIIVLIYIDDLIHRQEEAEPTVAALSGDPRPNRSSVESVVRTISTLLISSRSRCIPEDLQKVKYTTICEILNIPQIPRRTLSHRGEHFISLIQLAEVLIISTVRAYIQDVIHRAEEYEAAVVDLSL